MLTFDIITIFPEFFRGPFDCGIVHRARNKGLIAIRIHDLRNFASDRHRTVDDRPYGGGEGMVLKPEPIFKAVESLDQQHPREIVGLGASGRLFNQAEALRLSEAHQVILICGRYEGIDERVVESLATEEISIGDYVLSGGEIAAAAVVDAVTRYVPGAVGKEASILNESFSDPLSLQKRLDHPHYTRPADFRGMKVPEVLISGNHEAIRRWRHEQVSLKTLRNRPELLWDDLPSDDDRAIIEGLE